MKFRRILFLHFGIILGLLAVLASWTLSFFPVFTEAVYSRGLFRLIRWILDMLFNWLPFPGTLLLFTGLFILLIFQIRRSRTSATPHPIRNRLLRSVHRLLTWAGTLIFGFYILWGFNYQRVPVATQLELEMQEPKMERLLEELTKAGASASEARASIQGITDDTLSWDFIPSNLHDVVSSPLQKKLEETGFPAPRAVRARLIRPGGWMLSTNVAGIYNPFSGEGNVSTALMPVQIPFTMAHEMAHGHGFGDEGTCNFWALLACEGSADPMVRYSGYLAWWRYLAREVYSREPDIYKALFAEQSEGLKADLTAIRNNSRKYSGAISRLGSKVNDTYLKAQGVEGGIKNYNRVVLMRLAFAKQELQ